MKLFGRSGRKLTMTSFLLFLVVLLAACGSANTGDSSTPTTSGDKGKGCKNVGVLLPETASSARWDNNDKPLLDQLIKAAIPGATIQYSNAEGDATTQQNQAEAAMTNGACILVVGAADSDKAAAIVTSAKTQGVKVIAYDRLIQSPDLAYYVSFDNVKVGEIQGQYVVDHYKDFVSADKSNLVMINGSETDNNAKLFYQGAISKLQPLIDSKALNKVYDQYTPGWDNPTAQKNMEGALTAQNNNIQIAYVANDGMAGTVIAAIDAAGLTGKVLVTGQDATVEGIQRIIIGTQAMTVEKNYLLEAQGTADLVKAISEGTDTASLTAGATTKTSTGAEIPSVLKTPEFIDKSNWQKTVTDNVVTKDAICKGLPKDAKNLVAGYCG